MALNAHGGPRGHSVVDWLLSEVRRRRIRIWVDNGQIQYTASKDVMDAGFLAVLREHREELKSRLEYTSSGNLWLRRFTSGAGSDRVVFVLPAAGSGPSAFRKWRQAAPAEVEIVVVHLPGREERIEDVPFTDVDPLADRIAEQILDYGKRPFAIFGHCMGALVGREVAKRIDSPYLRMLAAAAATPPDMVEADGDPSDNDLVETLLKWGEAPVQLLSDPSVRTVLLAPLRTDLSVMATCRKPLSNAEKIGIPVVAFAGSNDDFIPVEKCARWAEWTNSSFELQTISGGHFFPVHQAAKVLTAISEYMDRDLA
ncbi:thioesterase II family protein [Nocardia arthritidis]|nr:alpha/beta fold hydrolase [Nocardia arthritidis]